MIRVPSTTGFLLLGRRSYTAIAEKARVQPPSMASKTKKTNDSRLEESTAKNKEIFWMKDPKTGDWIPENHFRDVDVAELRQKLLPKKYNY